MGKWILLLEIGCVHVLWHTVYSEVQSGLASGHLRIYTPPTPYIYNPWRHIDALRVYIRYIYTPHILKMVR
ncbi:MAG: hypothetical protein ACKO4W_12540 [Bacteroidota bacterium]